jgi:hypothetical protein
VSVEFIDPLVDDISVVVLVAAELSEFEEI